MRDGCFGFPGPLLEELGGWVVEGVVGEGGGLEEAVAVGLTAGAAGTFTGVSFGVSFGCSALGFVCGLALLGLRACGPPFEMLGGLPPRPPPRGAPRAPPRPLPEPRKPPPDWLHPPRLGAGEDGDGWLAHMEALTPPEEEAGSGEDAIGQSRSGLCT